MYIEKNLNDLKIKIKKVFNLEKDFKRLYYYDEKNITLNSEEDYEIMIMTMNQNQYLKNYISYQQDQRFIYLYFE